MSLKPIVLMHYVDYALRFDVRLSKDDDEYVIFSSSIEKLQNQMTELQGLGVIAKPVPLPVSMMLNNHLDDYHDEEVGVFVALIPFIELSKFNAILNTQEHVVARNIDEVKNALANQALSNQDLIDFTVAYRFGPYERLQELREKFATQNIDLENLTDCTDEYFDAADNMRQAIRLGLDYKADAINRFRKSAQDLGLDNSYTERLIAEQSEKLSKKSGILDR